MLVSGHTYIGDDKRRTKHTHKYGNCSKITIPAKKTYSATWCFRNRPSGPASLFLISSQETGHLASQFLRSNKKLSLRTPRYALSNAYTRCVKMGLEPFCRVRQMAAFLTTLDFPHDPRGLRHVQLTFYALRPTAFMNCEPRELTRPPQVGRGRDMPRILRSRRDRVSSRGSQFMKAVGLSA